jgi:2-iminobutanoate/2-iminopropanoate deaminase
MATVYLVEMDLFRAFKVVYRRYFPTEPPTRATVGVARLVADYRVEIEVIAAR